MKILGLDPGGTTGMAMVVYNKKKRRATVAWYDQVQSYDLLTDYELARAFTERLRKEKLDLIVIENFIGGGARTKHADKTMKLVGFMIGVSAVLGVPWILRVPQQRLPYKKDARECIPLQYNHALDALAHIFSYIKEKLCPAAR